jgi:hypothetical protein
VSVDRFYTTQLQAGLGLLSEMRQLIQIYQPGMTPSQLYDAALVSGRFPLVTARRLRNIVVECFAPRFLREPYVANHLKYLLDRFTANELNQLMFLHTARTNLILADFVREVYWPRYAAGRNDLELEDARSFVINSVREGKTQKPWSETTIKRISSYLMGCCADYGLLVTSGRNQRSIAAYRILPKVSAYLAYDLKLSGMGDNQVISSPDWALFGMDRSDVREQFKRMSLQGLLIYQSASDVVHIGWNYSNMEELINVITQS